MFIEENELHDIKRLLKGKKKPDAILVGLKKYFAEQFDCEIYAYICDKVMDGRLRLRFFVWDNAAFERNKSSKENSILVRYSTYFL